MAFTLEDLSPKEQAQFEEWTIRQGEGVRKNAVTLFRPPLMPVPLLVNFFFKATTLLQPVLPELSKVENGSLEYMLLIFQTMTALYHANAGRPYTWEEMHRRSRLEDAMTLYQLEVVSLEIAARIAGVSQSEFMDALGKAGISVFQYSLEEALAEAEAA